VEIRETTTLIIGVMKATVGTYHFGRHRNAWGIYVWDKVTETFESSKFIKDVISFEDAVREVYALNGWGTPKSIRRSY
jgi:hypothetical protein